MYGLVNKAVEQMVRSQLGDDTWDTIRQKAQIEDGAFLSLNQYPDDITYRLVEAASSTLGHSPAEILRLFGRYWMRYTAAEGYGELLALTGSDLWQFLHNLDAMHTRVGLSYPHLQPPSFECTDVTETSLHLHYYSDRPGITPMVFGLLEGLSERFATPIDIRLITSRADGAEHDIFAISKKPLPVA